uniref:Retinoblastoma-associated protein A-box domain-containing protein n=1 Tax=Aegilops tauschii TaxID=37682 RepID=M8CF40_AEGTA
MEPQPPPPPAVETHFADLCKELEVDEGVAGEAAALLEEGKDVFLTSPSFGSKSPEDVERLCFAFVLYCVAKLKGKGMKEESSRVRLWKILEGCKLKYNDFFKESQQLLSKIDHVLRSRYGTDWEDQLELKQLQSLVNLLADASRFYCKAFNELFLSTSTGQEPGSTKNGLIYFRDLLDKECFHSNFEKLEKLSSTTSWEGELDLKRFLINNDNIISAENSSRDFTNLSCPKRVFETLASPTKTIKNMLTVPSSPSSPVNGGSVKVVQMTPVTSAMTTAKWLRGVISSLPEKPSSKLEKFLSSCDTDLTSDVTKRVSIILEAIFPTKPSGHWGGSMGLNCTNAFDIPWAEARKMEASKLYYRVLEAICRAESLNTNVNNLTPLLSNERFHRCLIACSAELVLATHKTVIMMFPAVLESTGLTAFDLSKIIENFVRHEESLPRELKRHLNSLEEQLLESMAWEKGSSLYNSLVVARPSLASEINRLGLLAESMPSLDDIVARQNFHAEDLPATPSKKRAADSAETCLQSECPTVSNLVGGNEKCAEVGVHIFFSKILKLAAIRIRNLCERLRHVEQTEHVYNIFKQILDQQTTLFFNRHIDQLILCSLYGVAKGLGSRHVDIIVFYNEVFVPAVKPFLVALIPSGGAHPDNKKNPNSICSAL